MTTYGSTNGSTNRQPQATPTFWLDVGGTFTDCVARCPDGRLIRHKVLSSAVTKGHVGTGSTATDVVDSRRSTDPEHFWTGYRLRLIGGTGEVRGESTVAAFESAAGRLTLAEPLVERPQPGDSYELVGPEEAPILAIRYLLRLPLAEPIPPVSVRLGTTRGTNALLTRRGARTAFITTRGFGDILLIGNQNRPRLFDLTIRKPAPLFAAVLEIDERLTPDGEVLIAPDEATIRRQLAELRAQPIDSLAVCLLNGYCQPRHEELIERLAREAGFQAVSVSHRVAPLIKLVSRGDTTVVDAYLNPVLSDYVESLRRSLGPSADLRLLTSAGGLVAADQFRGKDSILSGPAGGVVGFSRAARAAGFARAIGFDMGGTSTDVSRFDGQYELEYETEKAGVRIVAPMMSIETVAAGGGSICRFDGIKLSVGPDSAGAAPGPACYGRGGPLAVTDVNVWLGRVCPEHFPFPLDRDAVARRLDEVNQALAAAGQPSLSRDELAEGFARVANANMAKAIRSISLAKGYDPRDYVLVAFGGAAPQHACAVAEELGIPRILNHPDAGVLSAYGIGLADTVRHRVAAVYRPYSTNLIAELDATFDQLADDARRELWNEQIPRDRIEVQRRLDVRYRGLDAFLTIARPPDGDYARQYVDEHRRLYGYVHENRELEVVAVRVEAVGRAVTQLDESRTADCYRPTPDEFRSLHSDGRTLTVPLYRREQLRPGASIIGPAIVAEQLSTTVIDGGWHAQMLTAGELLLERDGPLKNATSRLGTVAQSATRDNSDRAERIDSAEQTDSAARIAADADADEPASAAERSRPVAARDEPVSPVLLEVFNNQFAGIAEQMGITLRNTSSSVNVKERLDFSCALFTATGDLVVNAPHLPVHLGAMSETVRAVVARHPHPEPGDVFITNDPYAGGSHLPDVTVVTPVHDPATGRLTFFTASRAHHAEIGGISPGSMPPFSRNLAEEGVLIRCMKLVDAGHSRFDDLRQLLVDAPYPTRNVADNLADVTAQVAANRQGQRDLQRMVERYGLAQVLAYMRHIQDAAERKMRAALKRLTPGRRTFTDYLDDGAPITVAIDILGDTARIDFTGTGPVLAGNLNANRAIVTAAVLYVLRCLIGEDIPLNQGVLVPVEIIVPECLLNPRPGDSPETSPAVVGGNVETSQRVVDVLLAAFDLAAASQGTMNNLLFGDATFGYYETICGGSGATPEGSGADAVHTHMTNTRLTDPEVLERRFPVRVREFSIRRGSGGTGRHRGGDGIVRRLEFLRPMTVSLLTQRRGPYAPFGMHGGDSGQLGHNSLTPAGTGSPQPLAGRVQLAVGSGDVLTVETPGAGGWGRVATLDGASIGQDSAASA